MKKILLTLLLSTSAIADSATQLQEYADAIALPFPEARQIEIPESSPMPPIINDDQGVDELAVVAESPTFSDVAQAPEGQQTETPDEPTTINPMPPFIDLGATFLPLFGSHLEAEQNYYHCALGIDIWGKMIQGYEPDFQPYDVSSVIAPVVPFELCNGFELYPDSNLCSVFPDQATAEDNWRACQLTNFQYWDRLQKHLNAPAPKPPAQCKRFGGQNVYKARSETQDGAVIVMDRVRYCFSNPPTTTDMRPLNIYMTDLNGNRISNGRFRHCNQENNGRLHYDFPRGSGEAIIEILFEDERTECFYVPDRSRDQR